MRTVLAISICYLFAFSIRNYGSVELLRLLRRSVLPRDSHENPVQGLASWVPLFVIGSAKLNFWIGNQRKTDLVFLLALSAWFSFQHYRI